jgi:hypothetical protein
MEYSFWDFLARELLFDYGNKSRKGVIKLHQNPKSAIGFSRAPFLAGETAKGGFTAYLCGP